MGGDDRQRSCRPLQHGSMWAFAFTPPLEDRVGLGYCHTCPTSNTPANGKLDQPAPPRTPAPSLSSPPPGVLPAVATRLTSPYFSSTPIKPTGCATDVETCVPIGGWPSRRNDRVTPCRAKGGGRKGERHGCNTLPVHCQRLHGGYSVVECLRVMLSNGPRFLRHILWACGPLLAECVYAF